VLAARTARLAAIIAVASLVPLLAGLPAVAHASDSPGYYATPPESIAQFDSEFVSAVRAVPGQDVTMALLSTGVDPNLPGLAGKVTVGPNYTSPPGVALNRLTGTWLASLLATGLTSPVKRLISLRVTPQPNEPGANAVYKHLDELQIDAKAIRFAVDHGAQVIYIDATAEWGQRAPAALSAAVSYAVRKNVVLLAPEPGDPRNCADFYYPADLPGVIGVGEVMLSGDPYVAPVGGTTSACNNSIVVAAPSDEVRPDGGSAAGAMFGEMTAGIWVGLTVALIKEKYPDLSPAMVERALAMSARYHPAGGYDPAVGFGVLDPYQALVDAGNLASVTTVAPVWLFAHGVINDGEHFGGGPPTGAISALPSAGSRVSLSWAWIALGTLLMVSAIAVAQRSRRRAAR
jgi:hypothetical protein